MVYGLLFNNFLDNSPTDKVTMFKKWDGIKIKN